MVSLDDKDFVLGPTAGSKKIITYGYGPVFTPQRKVFDSDKETWVVYNASKVPIMPPLRREDGELDEVDLKDTQWFSLRYPFMGHAPKTDDRFSGLLAPLNVDAAEEGRLDQLVWLERKRPSFRSVRACRSGDQGE